MAGAGYKLFSTGEILTATNVNTYLMQQTVMVFASAAARTTALSGVLAEGMISYRSDSKVLEIYNGTSWVDFSGDITGITTAANSGLSGGATSGNVTLTLAVTAKGDHLIGTGSGTAAVLPIGTTNQTMIVDSTTTTGFKFASSAQSLLTAKGSIIAASAANTPAEQTVGSDGSILVANSAASTGLAYTPYFVAGKNKIINGDFGVWQRGTSFTVTGTESVVYKADRWAIQADGTTTTRTISQQTFTPGTAPVAGYEGTYYLRYAQTIAGNNSYNYLGTRLEDVRTLAGQTVTLSFWAKADSARTVSSFITQNFGSGGSGAVSSSSQSNSLTTSWQRFTQTLTLGSLTGKTIGTSSFLEITFQLPSGAITPTIDFWGVQLEAGSVATPFTTATGTIQGELAACQRYYWRITSGTISGYIGGNGNAASTTTVSLRFSPPVTLRINPSAIDYPSNLRLYDETNTSTVSSMTVGGSASQPISNVTTTGLTQYRVYTLISTVGAADYIGFSAEL